MGFFDFLTGKSKSAPAPAGATDTTAAPAETLKKELDNLGLDASNVEITVDGGRVTLSGSAPTQADAEKIILAIGNTKGVAEIENRLVPADGGATAALYVVKAGDTLWKIAEAHYGAGKGGEFERIFEANKPLLSHPDKIYPGQRLRIPGASGHPTADSGWAPPAEIADKVAGKTPGGQA